MLEAIKSPADLAGLNPEQLKQLSEEIRSFLIENTSVTSKPKLFALSPSLN